MPQTIRLEFAKSNTKVSKPKQPLAAPGAGHTTLVHPLTGRKYTFPSLKPLTDTTPNTKHPSFSSLMPVCSLSGPRMKRLQSRVPNDSRTRDVSTLFEGVFRVMGLIKGYSFLDPRAGLSRIFYTIRKSLDTCMDPETIKPNHLSFPW